MPYNVRRSTGKRKGKFFKQRDKNNIDPFLQRVANSGALVFPSQFGERRLIEMEQLPFDMWCKNCDNAIGIRTLEHESFNGIVSKWHIRCETCSTIIVVDTSKKSNDKNFDTNLKLATGILDTGIGETKVNTLLSVVNSPTIHHSTLKRLERVVGPPIENVAQASCVYAIEKEKMMSIASYKSQE
ncbi:hypothetical protein QAD02_010224 [Eretmocerus hayati]|uniref:Uncharacterized protein n=1 Tax=Eretmocerus hayati TaxID=131215 RepID=A0ACC2ND13_9HYME|nr:hypothetical protein QAD02_010224 [Eretmocerus hayati]